jgi:hypothetical protein
MFKTVVLKLLVKVALVAVKYKQPVYSYLTRFYMRVEVL